MATNWPAVNVILRNRREEILRSIEARTIVIQQAKKTIESSQDGLAALISTEMEISLWLKEHGGES